MEARTSMEAPAPIAGLATRFNRRYAHGLLTVVYVLSFLDRRILSILLQPIKDGLVLSDSSPGSVCLDC